MIKVLFLCHGNICRSVGAQMIFLNMLDKAGLKDHFEVDSAALTREEIGNPIYPPMARELTRRGIPLLPHRARLVTRSDIEHFDIIFYMDDDNEYDLRGYGYYSDKTIPIYKYGNGFNEIEDPWYSGRFDLVTDQITICLKNYLASLGM